MKSFIDTNNIDFRDSWPSVGVVLSFTTDGNEITAKYSIDNYGIVDDPKLLVVDAARRFVACAPIVKGGDLEVRISVWHLTGSVWPLTFYLYSPISNKAFPLKLSEDASKFGGNSEKIPTIVPELRKLCIEAMKQRYTSVSSKGGVKTGNNYQSIDFDTTQTLGGRPARNLFFDHVDLRGATVLDIGANTGEQSRLARKRGASLVDGIEYDKYFVEEGRAINAATGMTRVSLFQGDATLRDTYDYFPQYDMALAFAVWVYIDKVIDKIAEKTDVVFFETHTLDHGLSMYIDPMAEFFPHYRILGFDKKVDMRKSRCVILFAKTKGKLDRYVNLFEAKTEAYFDNKFFEAYSSVNSGNLMEFAKIISDRIGDENVKYTGIGKAYFETFVAGYYQYAISKRIENGNAYLSNYRSAITEGRLDQDLRYLLDRDDLMLQKVTRKFEDFDCAMEELWHLIPPPVIRPGVGNLSVHLTDGRTIAAHNMDGHHRFFIAQLLGRSKIDIMIDDPVNLERKVVKNNYVIE